MTAKRRPRSKGQWHSQREMTLEQWREQQKEKAKFRGNENSTETISKAEETRK